MPLPPLYAHGYSVCSRVREGRRLPTEPVRRATDRRRQQAARGPPRPMDWMALSPEEWTAVRLSLKVATVATLVALPFGIAIALALARGRFWGQSLLNGLVHLPLILPPVVTGYLLLILFGRRGPIGGFLADTLRHRLLVPLDRRGARLRRHGLSADGARHPPVDRGGRRAARGGRRHARRQPRLGVPHGHPAADPARHHRRA